MWAVQHDQRLNDTIAQLLEIGLANIQEDKVIARAPIPVRLKQHGLLTIKDIEAAIIADRD